MKKKVFFSGLIAILLIVGASVFNLNLNVKSDSLSDISLANVEALADGETPAEVCEHFCIERSGTNCVLKTEMVTLTCFNMARFATAK
jgi:hypothetical protein